LLISAALQLLDCVNITGQAQDTTWPFGGLAHKAKLNTLRLMAAMPPKPVIVSFLRLSANLPTWVETVGKRDDVSGRTLSCVRSQKKGSGI
jgi:hypothetical protein